MIVHAAAHAGVAPERLYAATGFDAAVAADPDAHIQIEVETALWEEAARLTGDDAFGLHCAEQIRPGAFDVLDYAVRTAPTLRASLERLARYNRLLHDVAVFTLVDRGEVVRVEHSLGGARQSRHAAEFTLASLLVIGGQISGAPLRALAVDLHPPPPVRTVEHERLFGVRPRFGTEVNAVELERAALERPVPTADPALSAVVVRHAEALLRARPAPSPSTTERVRGLVLASLADGDASLAAIAARLRMSERSLQRRLADEDTTFDELLEDVRRDLAVRYLASPTMAIAEVAYLLGYSEPSAFHRAFKRWTGRTPAEARRRAA